LILGLRPIALLALCAASFALFGWQLASDAAGDFLRENALAAASRTQLIALLAGSAVVAGLAGMTYTAFTGVLGVRALRLLSRITAPFTLIGLLPPLLKTNIWPDPLVEVMAIAVFVILFELLFRVSLGAWYELMGVRAPPLSPTTRRARRICTAIMLAGAAGYGIYASRYTLFQHWRFQTYNYDLGQYDNVFWNALHGRPMVCTPLGNFENWSSLGGHADLGVFFLLPFYAIYPHAETLLVMQSVLLGLGAIPVYFFAVRRLPPRYACVLAICYLLYPPMHGSNFYDFHLQPVAATFVLFTIWLVDIKRWFWATLTFIVAIACREDISVGLAFIGMYLVFTGYRWRAGAIMAVVAAAYFVVIRFYIMPRHGTGWFSDIYKDLYPRPTGPNTYGGVIQTLATNPTFVFRTLLTSDKLRYFLQIVTPIAFLPLRRPYLLPALAPGALFTLLTTAYGPTTDIAFQYSGHFTPYIFIASALALASSTAQRRPARRAALGALVVGTLLCTKHWGAFPPGGPFKGGFSLVSFAIPTAADFQKRRDLKELATKIPEGAPFAVSEQELPHVSGHLKVLALRDGISGAEYALYGTASAGANFAAEALARGDYVQIAERPGLALIKRK
jgi:uncharacterized membrane protein